MEQLTHTLRWMRKITEHVLDPRQGDMPKNLHGMCEGFRALDEALSSGESLPAEWTHPVAKVVDVDGNTCELETGETVTYIPDPSIKGLVVGFGTVDNAKDPRATGALTHDVAIVRLDSPMYRVEGHQPMFVSSTYHAPFSLDVLRKTYRIRMRATFGTTVWESPEPDTEPTVGHGFTDPNNPWGGLRAEMPEGICGDLAAKWIDQNAETVEFTSLEEAAEFVADFPGGVWDYSDSEHQVIDYATGEDMEVTLHVLDHTEAVHKRAREIETARDAALKERNR
jgi:hypothetical protein